MYPKIANEKLTGIPGAAVLENDVDKKVDSAITNFLSSLSQIGPELMSVSDSLIVTLVEFAANFISKSRGHALLDVVRCFDRVV